MRKRSWAPAVLALACAHVVLAQERHIPIRKDPGPRPLSQPFRLCAGGDVTLGTNLDLGWARIAADSLYKQFGLRADPDSLGAQLKPFLAGADVVLLNVESAIGAGRAPRKCGPRSTSCFAFRSPPSAANAYRNMVDSGVVVIGNVANNHARDAGDAGRDTTVALLERAGVFVTGYDTVATPVPLASGDTIGVLGFYTDHTAPDARDLAAVRRYVTRAAAKYDVVIVTMHLGAEGVGAQRTRNVNEIFLKTIKRGNPVGFANTAFDAGATMVIGHGPHVLRAAEWRGNRLALYSLGNLLTYGPFKLREPTNRGVVACASIDSARAVSSAELRSTMQLWPGVLQADSTNRAWKLIDSLSALDFPRTGVRVDSIGGLGRRGQGQGSSVPTLHRRDRRDAVVERQHSPRPAPDFDERRVRPIDRAFDHVAGGAARVDVASVADVDADVADVALLRFAEGQQVTGQEPAGVPRDGEALFGLQFRRARKVDLEGGHDVLHQTATVEALVRRRAAEPVARADLRFRHQHD